MAGDGTILNVGSAGDTIQTEQPGGTGVKYPVTKIYTGALDVNGGPVTATNPLDVRISDATNTASVKAASTAVAATDKALAVGLHPTSPLPAGTNIIGSAKITDGTNTAAVLTANPVAASPGLVVRPMLATDGTNVQPAMAGLSTRGFQQITDGTNSAAVKAASTAAAATDPALVVAMSPNSGVGTSANQATIISNQTTLGSQTSKLNDGTNTAAVKAASTAAATTDPALVVSVSPNTAVKTVQQNATSAQTNVAASVTSVTILASNTSRKGATIVNDSASVLYVLFGATASTTVFTVKMQPGDYYEVPFGYTGIIVGIWVTATGSARMTEIT